MDSGIFGNPIAGHMLHAVRNHQVAIPRMILVRHIGNQMNFEIRKPIIELFPWASASCPAKKKKFQAQNANVNMSMITLLVYVRFLFWHISKANFE